MRCVAGAGLLVLVGCNQILGISPAKEWDAGVDVVPAFPHVRLTWQVASVTASGGPDAMLSYPPITPAPSVRIARIDVPLDESQDLTSYGADGAIEIPGAYLDKTWRLEYTLPGEVPREVQWAPNDKAGHLAVPVFGRLERDPAPPDGGYTAMPTSGPASYVFPPRVFTTGLWTEGLSQPSGGTVDYAYFNATSLSGAKGRPRRAAGDRAFVVEFVLDASGCLVAAGSALIDAELDPAARIVQRPPWDAGRKAVATSSIDHTAPTARLDDALGGLAGTQGTAGTLMFGIGASSLMPGLTSRPALGLLSEPARLPVPMMLTLLRCDRHDRAPPTAAQPGALDAFPHLLHLQITKTRTVDGALLTSGIETVALSAATEDDVRFPAPIPLGFTLTNPAQQALDLGGAAPEGVAVGPVGGAFTLAFAPEAPSVDTPGDLRVDYYDVVLHRLADGALTAERIYTVTAPSVRLDGTVLAAGTTYVFEVRSYKGHPKAPTGDFTAVDYPYSSAVVFTRTFRTD
jgi:hypothetical protein